MTTNRPLKSTNLSAPSRVGAGGDHLDRRPRSPRRDRDRDRGGGGEPSSNPAGAAGHDEELGIGQTSTFIFTFITRGLHSPNPQGQGDELLFHRRVPSGTGAGELGVAGGKDSAAGWTCTLLEAQLPESLLGPIKPKLSDNPSDPIPAADEEEEEDVGSSGSRVDPLLKLSKKSISDNLPSLIPNTDLRLIRKGKKLPWDSRTDIIAFLWRTGADGRQSEVDHEGREGEGERERALKALDERLGVPDRAGWFKVEMFRMELESAMVATAFHSVYLVQELEDKMEELRTQDNIIDILIASAKTLYATISFNIAPYAFRFYPTAALSESATATAKSLSTQRGLKRRTWSYLILVIGWQLRKIRPQVENYISYSIMAALESFERILTDDGIHHDQFRSMMLNALELESRRIQDVSHELPLTAVDNLNEYIRFVGEEYRSLRGAERVGGVKGLGPNLSLSAAGASSVPRRVNIFTMSSSTEVLNVLTKMAEQTIFSSRFPGGGRGGISQAWRPPDRLHVVIGEGRPFCEGVALAQALWKRVVEFEKVVEDPEFVAAAAAGRGAGVGAGAGGYMDDYGGYGGLGGGAGPSTSRGMGRGGPGHGPHEPFGLGGGGGGFRGMTPGAEGIGGFGFGGGPGFGGGGGYGGYEDEYDYDDGEPDDGVRDIRAQLRDILGPQAARQFVDSRYDKGYRGNASFVHRMAELLANKRANAGTSGRGSKKGPPPRKVTIEVVPDAMMMYSIQKSSVDDGSFPPILLIGADSILSDGDVVSKAGTYAAAQMMVNLERRGRTFVIGRVEKILSHDRDMTEDRPWQELTPAWQASCHNDASTQNLKQFLREGMEKGYLKIGNQCLDRVPRGLVNVYITGQASGRGISAEEIRNHAETRRDTEERVWGEAD